MLVTIRRMTAIHRAVGPNRRGKVQAAFSHFMGRAKKVFRYRVTHPAFGGRNYPAAFFVFIDCISLVRGYIIA